MIYSYQYNAQEIPLSFDKIEQVMGYAPGTSPDPFPEMIREVMQKALPMLQLQGGYRIVESVAFDPAGKQLIAGEQSFMVDKIVFQQIKKSEKVAFFLCTAGPKIGEQSKIWMKEGDLMRGFIADTIGSIAVDEAMDLIQNVLQQQMESEGLHITNRYSPGYCNWNVGEQHKLFSFFRENSFGIRLSDTALMDPIKSVSGVIGIGKQVKLNPYTCRMCNAENCIYRSRL